MFVQWRNQKQEVVVNDEASAVRRWQVARSFCWNAIRKAIQRVRSSGHSKKKEKQIVRGAVGLKASQLRVSS